MIQDKEATESGASKAYVECIAFGKMRNEGILTAKMIWRGKNVCVSPFTRKETFAEL